MKKAKCFLALLLAVCIIATNGFANFAGIWAAAAPTTQKVYLRIEYAEATLTPPIEVNVPVGKNFADYGLPVTNDPGYVTPLHALAEYFVKEFGATREDITDYLGVSNSGYLQTIMGSSGTADAQGETYWMYAVNGETPVNPGTSYGYNINECPLNVGDGVVIFGIWAGIWGVTPTYYTQFSKMEIEAEAGAPVEVELLGADIYDMGSAPSEKIAGAMLLADEINTGGGFALTETGVKTDSNGKAVLTFDSPGTYVISAFRENTSYNKFDISRPYGIIRVLNADPANDMQLVDNDYIALKLPMEANSSLTLPKTGASGKTAITWSSNNTNVMTSDGQVIRPAVGKEDVTVSLTATITRNSVSRQKQMTITVKAYTEPERDADIARLQEVLATSSSQYFTMVEGQDNNVITVLQNKANQVIGGAVITMKDQLTHTQIDSAGNITYGDRAVKKNIKISIALGGKTVEQEVMIRIPAHIKTAQEEIDADTAAVTFDSIRKSNVAADDVRTDLNLYTTGIVTYGVRAISWQSSNPTIISTSGKVVRPAYGESAQQVTITATITKGAYSTAQGDYIPQKVAFTLTVPAITELEYNAAIAEVKTCKEWLQNNWKPTYIGSDIGNGPEVADRNYIIYDLQLSSSANTADVMWSSSNSQWLNVNYLRGKVTRPEIGQGNQQVLLIGTISKNGYKETLEIPLTIAAVTQQEIDKETVFLEQVKKDLTFEVIKGQEAGKLNASPDQVIYNLQMVYRRYQDNEGNWQWKTSNNGEYGAKITWETTNSSVLASYGTVTRPGLNQSDEEVVLTATITSARYSNWVNSVTVTFPITVRADSNRLAGIRFNNGNILFEPTVYSYNIPVRNIESQVRFTPAVAAPDSEITEITGAIRDGSEYVVVLSEDSTIVTVTVESQSGVNNTYTFSFNKVADPLPDYQSIWPLFRQNIHNMGLTTAKTPTEKNETALNWEKRIATGTYKSVGSPIIVGSSIFVAADDQLIKLDKQGNVIAKGQLASRIGYFSYLAYGNGMVFVTISGGRIQAFNADTLVPIWITEELPEHQANSPMLYYNGYVYTGTVKGGAATSTDGVYYCVLAADEKPAETNEIKNFTWKYEIKNQDPSASRKGFYWSGAAVAQGILLFGGDNGQLVAHHLTEDIVIDTFQAQGDIRCSIAYNETNSMAYFTTKGGKVYAVPVNGNGTFQKSKVKEANIGGTAGQSTCTPVVYKNRLYVGSGTMDTENGVLNVMCADTLQTIYTVDLPGITQSSPLVTTAYASEKNQDTVYVYMTINDAPGSVICIKDNKNSKTAKATTLFSPKASAANFCTASLIAGQDGALYYANDSGYLFALKMVRTGNLTGDANNTENTDRGPNTGDVSAPYVAIIAWMATGVALVSGKTKEGRAKSHE